MKTNGHGYHVDLELRDRSDSRFGYPLEIALGVGESARAWYVDVIRDMN